MEGLLVILLFWPMLGVYSIKLAMEEGNDRMWNMQTVDFMPLFFKSLFFGPFTRSKLIGGKTIPEKRAEERVRYKKTLNDVIAEANTGFTQATLNNIKNITKEALMEVK